MADPMHQFEVTKIVDLPDFSLPGVGVIDMAITNSTVAMAIAAGLVVAFFALATARVAVVPGRMQVVGESVFGFIDDLAISIIGPEGRKFFPFVFTLFVFILAMNVLGLFLVLPVFALEARKYPGGDDPALVGLAMGIYGLTQAVLQLPLGMASDRFGRKRVIVLGLLVFAAGSLLAALADSLTGLLVGRAMQGAGAVSAAVTALLADQTRDAVRTKAMALVGGSIGLMFAVALVAAPVLAAHIGLAGLFGLTCALALAGVAVVIWWVPAETAQHQNAPRGRLADVWAHPDLLRLNLGVFVLHTVQLSMWVAVPAMLVQAGLSKDHHWQVYLPAVVLSFAAMGGLFALERVGRLRAALLGAIALVLLVQAGLGLLAGSGSTPTLWVLGPLLPEE